MVRPNLCGLRKVYWRFRATSCEDRVWAAFYGGKTIDMPMPISVILCVKRER
jgi:hypothetical protein